ncbi:hypothetical protein M8C21_026129 [Ambrosia artemisiifolia]|uniref:Protein kinase domain-containing protein n=1 Tax=Ambrosia artemisiifolia TaxID=4212 RepID=A0AAD5BUL4_AMBAR|nr:hypothetical protein M8C21_026129 [Ambrosia artemisiifolia]
MATVGHLFFLHFFTLILLVQARLNLHTTPLSEYNDLDVFSQLIKSKDLAFLEKDDGCVASLQIIGKGGCGEVYTTELPESKIKTIAIKKVIQTTKDAAKLTQEERKKLRQVKSEIQTVGLIRHPNILPLLAHVYRPDCHCLVYEIALGVAAGLEYLHLIHDPRIVHRDLKPANVLLDDDMEARITDFGLAKAILGAKTYVETFHVAGTLGYMAPEYYEMMELTEKCDIYSFGVLLATLVMGKLPTDEFFKYTYEMGLVIWMRNMLIGDDPKQLIDPKLMGNGYEEQMLHVLKVACSCTLDNPNERPDSKDARLMLAQIQH